MFANSSSSGLKGGMGGGDGDGGGGLGDGGGLGGGEGGGGEGGGRQMHWLSCGSKRTKHAVSLFFGILSVNMKAPI